MDTRGLHQHFKVEYDKANVITSYPSVLPEEIDVFLNKAYLMILNQKFTGNNYRKIAFEGDIKRISDLQKLVVTSTITTHTDVSHASNAIAFDLNELDNYLYYVTSTIKLDGVKNSIVILTSHAIEQNVKETDINKPWLPKPVAEIENDKLIVYYDPIKHMTIADDVAIAITYIKKPFTIDITSNPDAIIEVEDSVALEIVDLAVFLALENIESQRTETKGQTLIMQE